MTPKELHEEPARRRARQAYAKADPGNFSRRKPHGNHWIGAYWVLAGFVNEHPALGDPRLPYVWHVRLPVCQNGADAWPAVSCYGFSR